MNARTLRILGITCLSILLRQAVQGEEWSQFRGPEHNGASSEKILKKWPATGLVQIWKAPMTDGFSAITTGGGKAFTLETRENDGAQQEICVALDARTGKEIWISPLGVAKYDDGGDHGAADNDGGDGPRSTPSYSDGKVYTYSSRMILKCLNAEDGKLVWSSDVMKDHGGKNIHWESAASPLVEGNLVFVCGGGSGESLLAFDKNSGQLKWKGQSDSVTHSTPVAATILGTRQIIFYTQSGLVSVAPQTGEVLWRYPFKYRGSAAISPVVSGDIVYVSAAYGIGTGAYKITKTGDEFAAAQIWFEPANVINNHWSTPVCANGYVYGIYGQAQFGHAPLKCVELATGKVMWSQDGFGPGGCTLVDGNVMVLSDAGDLVLVKASPAAYSEVARSHILAGKCWNSAGISDGHVFARSTREGVCLDISPR